MSERTRSFAHPSCQSSFRPRGSWRFLSLYPSLVFIFLFFTLLYLPAQGTFSHPTSTLNSFISFFLFFFLSSLYFILAGTQYPRLYINQIIILMFIFLLPSFLFRIIKLSAYRRKHIRNSPSILSTTGKTWLL